MEIRRVFDAQGVFFFPPDSVLRRLGTDVEVYDLGLEPLALAAWQFVDIGAGCGIEWVLNGAFVGSPAPGWFVVVFSGEVACGTPE